MQYTIENEYLRLTVDSPTLSEEELHKKFAAFLAG